MFDLESALTRWRRQLAASVPSTSLQELENHLREEVESLVRGENTTEQAFLQACQRLGDPARLSTEFAKLARSEAWLPTRLAYMLTVGLLGLLLIFLGGNYFSGKRDLLLTVHVFLVVMGYSTAFMLGGLGTCFVLARPFRPLTPGQSVSLRRGTLWLGTVASVTTALGVVCGMFWAKNAWGRYWAWDAKEVGGLAILIWTVLITLFAGSGWGRVRSIMFLTVLGNIITALGWFGSNLIYSNGSSYSNASVLSVSLTWFLGAQLLLLVIGLLPDQWLPSRQE